LSMHVHGASSRKRGEGVANPLLAHIPKVHAP
jgi:hypothetical protein